MLSVFSGKALLLPLLRRIMINNSLMSSGASVWLLVPTQHSPHILGTLGGHQQPLLGDRAHQSTLAILVLDGRGFAALAETIVGFERAGAALAHVDVKAQQFASTPAAFSLAFSPELLDSRGR